MNTQPTPSVDWPDVFHEQHGFVAGVVRRLAGPDLEVDDLVQDVFVVVHRRLSTIRDERKLRPWIYGICRRVVSHQRRKSKVRDRLWQLWGRPLAPPPSTPEEQTQSIELERRLYSALDELTSKRREVLVLFALEELSGKEIAELLQIPEATVWTRLHSARKQLMAHLENSSDTGRSVQEHLRWNN